MVNLGVRYIIKVVILSLCISSCVFVWVGCGYSEEAKFLQEIKDGMISDNLSIEAATEEGKLMDYTGIYRDPFLPQIIVEIKQQPVGEEVIEGTETPTAKPSELFSFSIQGIIWDCRVPMAIVNQELFKKGDSIIFPSKDENQKPQVTIIDIDKEGITVSYKGEVEKIPSPSSVFDFGMIKGGK